ncbi:peptidase [Sphaerisporangium siamense]|uniref:Putative metalloprotease n=1 Tax=Sphaerisporangium siamense TaxID=795645 RepID=A0A7W7DD24_9ACTN|nr:neutral zinc metallopeptidase [Sphaerisporangium siamense]MBB4704610.1 putative metalloprotease [Sphaerisporangium siamense]GII86224.1 peptidase [Sphaerisporangium siamense]
MRRILAAFSVCAVLASCAAEPARDAAPLGVGRWHAEPSPTATPTRPVSPARAPDRVPPPQGRDAAVRSPLYAVPKVPRTSCRLPVVRAGSLASMRRYGNAFSACLDRVWAREFKAARTYFTPPRRVFVPRRVKDRECGTMPSRGADGTYCPESRAYYVLLERDDLSPDGTALVADLVAHEYAHHVQHMVNILDWEAEAAYGAKRAVQDVLSRRLELQATCLGGVALHLLREALPPWSRFQESYQGTLEARWVRDHGRSDTQSRWLERGFRSGRPKACDTWTVPVHAVT